MIDAKGLLRGDQQRGDASDRAREEEALIIHLSDNNLVRAIQHPVRECSHTIPMRHGETQSHQVYLCSLHVSVVWHCAVKVVGEIHTFVYAHAFRIDKKNTVQAIVTHLLVWSLRAEFGAISNSSASTLGLSMLSSS